MEENMVSRQMTPFHLLFKLCLLLCFISRLSKFNSMGDPFSYISVAHYLQLPYSQPKHQLAIYEILHSNIKAFFLSKFAKPCTCNSPKIARRK